MPREGGCAVVRQGRCIALVRAFLIGCAVLLVAGCAGVVSEAPEEEQGHTEAPKKEQARSPEATTSEEASCEGTRTFKHWGAVFTTNDLPGCPNKGGLLSGTDRPDELFGGEGEDKVHGLGAADAVFGGSGNDVIYAGPGDDLVLDGMEGDDLIYGGDGDDMELYGGKGKDVIYGGDGSDTLDGAHGPLAEHQRNKLYCGAGTDYYRAGGLDYVDSSCEKKMRRPRFSEGVP